MGDARAFDETMTYMGYLWVNTDDGVLTIGINEDGLEEFSEILSINLPAENEEVSPDEVCGEVETDQGPMNIYSPIAGRVSEVNEAVVENASLIQEDCFGDGWLLKIEPDDSDDLDKLTQATTNDDE